MLRFSDSFWRQARGLPCRSYFDLIIVDFDIVDFDAIEDAVLALGAVLHSDGCTDLHVSADLFFREGGSAVSSHKIYFRRSGM